MDIARIDQVLLILLPTFVIEAAGTLGLPHPDRPVHSSLARPELRRLLHTLAEAGLVLPPALSLSAPNGRQ
jgi:hypothetical protein